MENLSINITVLTVIFYEILLGKPIGGFTVVVRNLRAVFSFIENDISPSFIWGFMVWVSVVEKVLHKQQFSDKTSRVRGLEKVLLENACLTVKCLCQESMFILTELWAVD